MTFRLHVFPRFLLALRHHIGDNFVFPRGFVPRGRWVKVVEPHGGVGTETKQEEAAGQQKERRTTKNRQTTNFAVSCGAVDTRLLRCLWFRLHHVAGAVSQIVGFASCSILVASKMVQRF